MRYGIRRACMAFAVLTLALPAIFLAQTVVFPGVAEARCAGAGNRVTSTLEPGSVWVSEVPEVGTCNNNNTYQGVFRAHISGWRASVWIQNNGVWSGWVGGYDTGWYAYSYHDDNSHSLIHLCMNSGSGTWWCGWGGNAVNTLSHAFYGVNHGF